MSRHDMIC